MTSNVAPSKPITKTLDIPFLPERLIYKNNRQLHFDIAYRINRNV
jgi:hypothetical protein